MDKDELDELDYLDGLDNALQYRPVSPGSPIRPVRLCPIEYYVDTVFLLRKGIDENYAFLHDTLLLMAVVAQLVRALDCGSKCRGFESRRSPFFLAATHLFPVLEF